MSSVNGRRESSPDSADEALRTVKEYASEKRKSDAKKQFDSDRLAAGEDIVYGSGGRRWWQR